MTATKQLAKTIQSHDCKTIKNIETVGVEKIEIPADKARWFLRFGMDLNEIKYCPYCGKKLGEE